LVAEELRAWDAAVSVKIERPQSVSGDMPRHPGSVDPGDSGSFFDADRSGKRVGEFSHRGAGAGAADPVTRLTVSGAALLPTLKVT
jgi:hypothetical protein